MGDLRMRNACSYLSRWPWMTWTRDPWSFLVLGRYISFQPASAYCISYGVLSGSYLPVWYPLFVFGSAVIWSVYVGDVIDFVGGPFLSSPASAHCTYGVPMRHPMWEVVFRLLVPAAVDSLQCAVEL